MVSLFSVCVDGMFCGMVSGCRLIGRGIMVVWMLMGILIEIGFMGGVNVVCMVSLMVLMVVLMLWMWKVVFEIVLSMFNWFGVLWMYVRFWFR